MGRGNHWLERSGWLIVAALLLARLHLLAVRLYDPDEFEHLHAGFCVERGMLPYRDFFEHHGPLPYYLAAPLVRWLGPELILLTGNRLLSFAFVLGTVALTWRITAVVYGRRAALLSLVLLLSMPWFVEKSVEWRPDVPAVCLLAVAASLSIRADNRPVSGQAAFLSGLAIGLAGLCTQKTVFCATGIVLGSLVTTSARGGRLLMALAAASAGSLCALLTAFAWFAAHGAHLDFLRCFVYYPLIWPRDVPDPHQQLAVQLFGTVGWSPGHWGLIGLGLVIGLVRLFSPRPRRRGETIVSLAALVPIAGLFVTPAVYLQYYLLFLPFAASLAGGATCALWNTSRASLGWPRRRFLGTLPLLSCSVFIGIDSVTRASAALASRLQLFTSPYGLIDAGIYIGIVLAMLATLWRPRIAAVLIWTTLLSAGVGRVAVPHFYWPRDGQIRQLNVVHSQVPPDGTVMDGFSGLGCLRPHACYWWWINEHSLALLHHLGRVAEVVDCVAKEPPALIIYDENLRRLHLMMGPIVDRKHEPAPVQISQSTLLFKRKE